MKLFRLKTNTEFEIEAEDEEEAREKLEDELNRDNTTANNLFWDNMEVEENKR